MLDEFGHEMYPEDENALLQIKRMVESIWRGLHGSDAYNQKGIIKDFADFKLQLELKIKEIELRLLQLEQNNKRWLIWVTAFGLGVVITTGIYFGLSLKEIKNFIK